MAFPKFSLKKKENKNFLLIEIGLEVVNMAKLSVDPEPIIEETSRKKFAALEDMFNASIEAIDELAGKVTDIPKKAILGVSGGPIRTETTVAQYTRPDPNEAISREEVEKVLEEVSVKEEAGELKLFFSTIASAKIDGTKVSNPIGIKGEKADLSCFIAYKHPEELAVFDKLVDEIDMELEKIIPTSFAVAKLMLKKGNENALLFRLGSNRSEVAHLLGGHINRIVQFDLGVSNPELLLEGFELVVEEAVREEKPELIWLYPDSSEVDMTDIKDKLLHLSWKDFGFHKDPRISFDKVSDVDAAEDTGLLALSLEITS